MKSTDFILIQVNPEDEYFELARIRPYRWRKGFYCDGMAQNNGSIYEFSLHLGTEQEIKNRMHILLPFPECTNSKFDKNQLLISNHNDFNNHDFSYYNDCEGIGV